VTAGVTWPGRWFWSRAWSAVATASVWQARQPVYATSIERWRRYEPWLGELRQLLPAAAGAS
jgi:hypothetical protein